MPPEDLSSHSHPQRQTRGTVAMANVLVLIHGESRHLVPKPADYADLLHVARGKFHELHDVNDDNIAFHFTPEWFDGEVEIDGGAFAEVQNRAILRITTTASPGSDDDEIRDDDVPAHHTGSPSIKDDDRSSVDIEDLPVDLIKVSFIHVPTNRKMPYKMAPCAVLYPFVASMAARLQFDLDNIKLVFQREVVQVYDTTRGLGLEDGDVIEVHDA